MSESVIRDIALADHSATHYPMRLLSAATVPGHVARAVLFERVLLSTPLFFPVTLDLHAFRDAFQIDGLYLAEAYDAVFDPAFAAGIEGRRQALAAAPPGDADIFVLGGSSNHFHWLLDFLPRLALAATPDVPATVVVHADFHPAQRPALDLAAGALGLPELNLRPVPDGVVGVRRARMPLAVGRPAAVAFWRHVLAAAGIPHRPHRRLFVRRGNVERRRLVDEDASARFLALHGFEAVDPGRLAFAQQAALFAEAAVVVGPHGAALANAAFMAPGGTLVEFVGRDAPTPFANLASAAGLRYGALRLDTAGTTPAEHLNADLHLPAGALEALVRGL
ncbi:uncharacterized protein DUF563 [Stella humosa]|uniref:Uncharacterized protein DUF563 n=1 Tax=Stella humosa TaxID=94 RepID=A0A3N1KZI8_9PROT|nr:glycosyltransferase 61 family protein [Stella humosa]ROP83616.1 uncharacterized protein DUF563 [Stella humosa]BBK33110.1 hypothetical protein STHU_37440 [Stella humosa]